MRASWLVLLVGCSKPAVVTPEFRWSESEPRLEAVGHEHEQWIERSTYGDRPYRIGLGGHGLPVGTRISVGKDETTITGETGNLMVTVQLEPFFAAAPITALTSNDGLALPPVEVRYPEATNATQAPLMTRGAGDQIVDMLERASDGPVEFAGEPASTGDDAAVVIARVTGAGGSPERTVKVLGTPRTVGDLDWVALIEETTVGAKVCGRYDGHDGAGLQDAAFTFTGRRVRIYLRRTGKKVVEKTFHDRIACPDSITYGGMADMDLKSGGPEADAWLADWFAKRH